MLLQRLQPLCRAHRSGLVCAFAELARHSTSSTGHMGPGGHKGKHLYKSQCPEPSVHLLTCLTWAQRAGLSVLQLSRLRCFSVHSTQGRPTQRQGHAANS